ncbi:hypothetical protein PHISP_08869, partial [Aspergillus sp. HF37]
DRGTRARAEGAARGRADHAAILQACRPGRDVGRRQPRAEPALGRDEDLSGGGAAAAAARPPRGGAV